MTSKEFLIITIFGLLMAIVTGLFCRYIANNADKLS